MANETYSVFNWNQLVVEPLNTFFMNLAGFVPDVVKAVCILVVGWLVGRVFQLIVSFFLRSIGFDGFAKKIGITALLEEGTGPCLPSKWFGMLTFWVVVFISIMHSFDTLRLRIASSQLGQVMHFTVQLCSVFAILIIGLFLSFIASRIIRAIAENLKMSKPQWCANLTRYIVLIFTMFVCLMELGLPAQIVFAVVGVIFVTLCITFILAFGIGGVSWAGKVLDKTIKDKQ